MSSLCGACLFSALDDIEKSPAIQSMLASQSSNLLATIEGMMSARLSAHTSNLSAIVCDMLVLKSSGSNI